MAGLNDGTTGLSEGTGLDWATGLSGGPGLTNTTAPPVPAAPINLALPAISGSPYSGSMLSCSTGAWSGYPRPTYAYQWKANGTNIGGATSNSYTLTDTELTKTITCVVTATNASGSASATSPATAAVTTALTVPVNTVAPAITGTPNVGSLLTCSQGTWTGNPTPTYAYQWFYFDTVTAIGGATSSTYTPVSGDVGHTLSCNVTATNSQGSVSASSAATAAVTAALAAPVNTAIPVISGTAQDGQTLTATTGTWTGNPTPTYAYQWKRAGTNISGATSSTYLIVTADVGNTLTVAVTATNSQGSASATSSATATVIASGSVQDILARDGSTLLARDGSTIEFR